MRAARLTSIVLLALALLPLFAGRNLIQDLIFLFYVLALAQCWNLLAGYAGLISVGQQAFVGLGGYLLFALTLLGGLDPLLAILLAGLVSGLFALPTALIVFRLRGAYFAIGTWVVAEVYRLVFAQFKPLGGGTGTSLGPSVTSAVPGIEWVKTLLDIRTPAARDIIRGVYKLKDRLLLVLDTGRTVDLAVEGADGLWAGGACFPAGYRGDEPGQPWTPTMHTLQTLQILGLEPESEAARRGIPLGG